MNVTESIPIKNQNRLRRIKTVSRIAKYICFVFLAFAIGFSFLFSFWSVPPGFPKPSILRILLVVMFQIVLWLWYWKLTRLFGFYERGMIFAAETIRCIKILGLLFIIGWMLTAALHFLPILTPHTQIPLSPEGTMATVKTTSHYYRMGFFSFDFGTGINFGQLLLGVMIVLIAWIMDEGRKIQEEQELTV